MQSDEWQTPTALVRALFTFIDFANIRELKNAIWEIMANIF